MILQALDTIHVSAVSSENITTGQTFEIDELSGRSLIERGLAIEVDAATTAKAENPAKAEPHAPEMPNSSDAAELVEPAETAPITNKGGVQTRKKAE